MTTTSTSTTPDAAPIEDAVDQALDTPPDAAGDDLTADQTEGDQDATDGKPGRDAAKYRRQLREVEADRDQLRTVVASLQKAEAERLAGVANLKPAALWASGAGLADLLAADGTVDPDKVTAAAKTAKELLGIVGLPAAPPASGQGNVGSPAIFGATNAFEDAFKPRH